MGATWGGGGAVAGAAACAGTAPGGFGGATGAVATGAGCGSGLAIAASSTAVRSCFNSLALAAVWNSPPVLCATQARGLSVCFALGSKPMTWMRNPGAACFSDFTVAQTLALQLSRPSVMSTTSRPAGGVCLAASTSAAATGRPQLWLEACPEQKLARRLRGELARLGDELGLGARLALAVTGGDQAKGDAVLIGLERLPESGPHDDDLALGAKLRPHAARAVEHDDG